MLNHVRTLLLNKPPGHGTEVTPLGHPIDKTYQPVPRLPDAVQRARALLFGARPDAFMLNYRLHQLMTCLYASPLADHADRLDPRTTFTRHDAGVPLVDPAWFTPRVERLSGSIPVAFTPVVFGSPASPDATGQTTWEVKLSITTGPDACALTVTAPAEHPVIESTPISFTTGSSAPIPLSWSGYSAVIRQSGQAGTFLTSFYLRPTWSLGQIVAGFRTLGATTVDALLGPVNTPEPFKTYRKLIEDDSADVASQVAAICMTVALCTAAATDHMSQVRATTSLQYPEYPSLPSGRANANADEKTRRKDTSETLSPQD